MKNTAWVMRATMLVLALSGLACRERPARPGLPPRNLLLVTVGELRPDSMSCYDNLRPTTWLPKDSTQIAENRAFDIDELARTGVLFTRAYAPIEKMIPSVVSLFTGHGPRTSGMLEFDQVGADVVPTTLTEVLRDDGFETVALITHRPPKEGLNLKAILLEDKFETFHECADDEETLLRARDWVGERDFGNDRPFFLWLHLGGLTPPYRPPQAGKREPSFTWDTYVGPARRSRDFLLQASQASTGDVLEPDPEDWAYLAALYDGALADVTRELAGFLAEVFDFHLPAAELTETWSRTLFVLTAPTGTDFQRNRAALGYAREVSEQQLHVPLILRHPDSLTGERVFDEVVELADVMPTVLEWFELETPAGVTGRSLLGLTDHDRTFETRPAIATLRDAIHTARSARWRLIWDPRRLRYSPLEAQSDVLLFDCRRDPTNVVDVAADHPGVVRELRAELEAWVHLGREPEQEEQDG